MMVNQHTPVIMNLIRIFAVASLSFGALETNGSEIKDSFLNLEVNDTANFSSEIDVPVTLNDNAAAQMGSNASDALVPTVTEVSVAEQITIPTEAATTSENPESEKTFEPLRIVINRENLYEDLLSAFKAEKPENVQYRGFEIRMKHSEGVEEEILKITSAVLKSLDLAGILNRLEQDGIFSVDEETGETITNFYVDHAKLRLFGFVSALIAKNNLRNGVRLPGAALGYLLNPNQSCLELLKHQDLKLYKFMIGAINNVDPLISSMLSFENFEKPCLRANPHPQTPAEIQEYFEYAACATIQIDNLKHISEGFGIVMPSEMMAACNMTVIDLDTALTTYSDYTGDQLKTNCAIENIEGNRHLVDWFFTAIDKLTPHERRRFLFFFTGLSCIPREGFKSLKPQPKIFIENELDKFNHEPTSIQFFKTIRLYKVESFEKMLENLKNVANAMEN